MELADTPSSRDKELDIDEAVQGCGGIQEVWGDARWVRPARKASAMSTLHNISIVHIFGNMMKDTRSLTGLESYR